MKEHARKLLESNGIEVGSIHDRGLSPPIPKLQSLYVLNVPSFSLNSLSLDYSLDFLIFSLGMDPETSDFEQPHIVPQ